MKPLVQYETGSNVALDPNIAHSANQRMYGGHQFTGYKPRVNFKKFADNLGKHLQKGTITVQEASREVKKAFREGAISPWEYSVADLFRAVVPDGEEVLTSMRTRGQDVMEAAPGVVTTAVFAKLNKDILTTEIMKAYENPEFIGRSLVTNYPTNNPDRRKLARIGRPGEHFDQEVEEGHEFPTVNLSEEWVTIPRAQKWGAILNITKEVLSSDLSDAVITAAAEIGTMGGFKQERDILRMVLGETDTYSYKDSTPAAVYQTTTPYVNSHTNVLADYTDIDAAEQLFSAMTDPATGLEIMLSADTIITSRALKTTAWRIVNSIQINQGDITAGAGIQTVSGNPVGPYRVLQSPLVAGITGDADHWFIGTPTAAFGWSEVYPLVVDTENNGPLAFSHDIPVRYKVSWKGVAFCYEPRYMVENTD